MIRRLVLGFGAALVICAAIFSSAALGATPAPAWKLSATALPTNFVAGSSGTSAGGPEYLVVATNIGGSEKTGAPIALSIKLPPGVTAVASETKEVPGGDPKTPPLSCVVAPTEVSCATAGPVRSGWPIGLRIPVEVSLAAASPLVAKASVSGGGAASATTITSTPVSSEPATFGFLPGLTGLNAPLTEADGSPSVQAGSHPYQQTVEIGLPSEKPGGLPTGAGHVRDVVTDLPRGMVVNPDATPARCTEAQLTGLKNPGEAFPDCPIESQIGTVTVLTIPLSGPQPIVSPLFNMVPPPGAAAELGFNAANVGIYIHIIGGVRSNGDYGLTANSNDLLALVGHPIVGIQLQLWGDPSSSSHDHIRGEECRLGLGGGSCPVDPKTTPLLTMPSACSGPLAWKASADSWEEAGAFKEALYESADLAGNPVGVNGCSVLDFEPSLALEPDTATAESPTGVHVDLHVPQHPNLGELATSNVKDTTVSFPVGMAVNPSAATGLAACTPAQIGMSTKVGETPPHFSAAPANCPDASKIGTVQVSTPLLDHPLPGSVYVAQPYQNPFNSLLAVYIAVNDPQTGIVAKLAGKTEADPVTGQLKTTFEENPELPFEDFKVDLFGGPRAALRTPSSCGSFATTSVQTPWSGSEPVHTSDSFQVNQGANGGPCAASEAQMPDAPGFEAGTATPLAASYSPFLGRLQRPDGSQQLRGLNLTLPPGLAGKLAGVPACSEAAIAVAANKSGTAELASPSCPAASQIGEVKVGAGAGSQPYYTTGKVYLAGPYEGAPISAAVITPAVAGPFDLGTVVVRAALYVDRESGVISVKSDPFPRILQGIPLEVRDVRVNMNRPDFTLNPTNCNPMTIGGEAISALGHVTPLSDRFQVGGCSGLDFEPHMTLSLEGGTRRGAHPALRVVGSAKPGEANLAYASVALPHSEFLDQAHIRTVCTRVQFNANQCPAGAVYGHITAKTPLLDETLSGPVYLRSSSHQLPDLVAVVRGPASRPIEVDVVGRIDSINGGIRTTVEAVPDVPVSKFVLTMQGARKGLLINSRDLCASVNRATVKLNGQNGKTHDFRPALKAKCGSAGKAKRGEGR